MMRPAAAERFALLGATALCALHPSTSIAQDDVVELPTIVLDVEAEEAAAGDRSTPSEISAGGRLSGPILDIPASVSIVTNREMEQRSVDSVEEAIDYTAGVVTDSYGADDRFDYFSIRGFNAYTYRDGLRIGENFGGIREQTFAYERVEVIKGGTSSVFGISDPGGMVNYVTKTPTGERFGQIYGSVGSFDTVETGLDFGDALNRDGSLSYRLTGLLREGKREYPHSEDDEVFLMGGLSWQPSEDSELTLVIDHLDSDDVPGSGGFPIGYDFDRTEVFFGEPDYNYRGAERQTATLIARHDFGGGLSFGGTARYTDASDDFGYAYVSGQTDDTALRSFFASDSTEETVIADAHLRYESRIGNVLTTTLIGLDAFRTDETNARRFGPAPSISIDDPVYTGEPDEVPLFAQSETEREGQALYLQQEVDWDNRVIASLGLRHDWIDITDRNLLTDGEQIGEISTTTGRVGLTYKATPDLSFFGSYAESVVPADVGVDPEEGDQIEIGAKWRPMDGVFVTASLYDLSKTNIARANPVTNRQELIGEIQVRGVELEAQASLGAFEVTAAYSHLDPEIVESGALGNNGNQPARVPNDIGSLWVDYTLEGQGRRGDLTFGVGARYGGSYYYDDANEAGESDSYVAVDTRISYGLTDSTEISVNAANLLDEKHVAFGGFYADFYSPGREITATLRHRW